MPNLLTEVESASKCAMCRTLLENFSIVIGGDALLTVRRALSESKLAGCLTCSLVLKTRMLCT